MRGYCSPSFKPTRGSAESLRVGRDVGAAAGFKPTRGSAERLDASFDGATREASNPRGVRLKDGNVASVQTLSKSFKPTRGSAESATERRCGAHVAQLQTHEGFG